jgi:hypothetical protein
MPTINESLVTLDAAAVNNHRVFCGRVQEVAQELGVGRDYAAAISYLRSKPYWTQVLEDELVSMSNNDEILPNMLTYGK